MRGKPATPALVSCASAGIRAARRIADRDQLIPRPTGGLMGLELSLHPFSLNPSFKAIADLPLAEKVKAMRDPALRAKLISEEPDDPHSFFKFFVS